MSEQTKPKKLTVRQSVKNTFNEMPNNFGVFKFCIVVRAKLSKHTMDGTILRRLRELRESGECDYKVIDTFKGIYQKIE